MAYQTDEQAANLIRQQYKTNPGQGGGLFFGKEGPGNFVGRQVQSLGQASANIGAGILNTVGEPINAVMNNKSSGQRLAPKGNYDFRQDLIDRASRSGEGLFANTGLPAKQPVKPASKLPQSPAQKQSLNVNNRSYNDYSDATILGNGNKRSVEFGDGKGMVGGLNQAQAGRIQNNLAKNRQVPTFNTDTYVQGLRSDTQGRVMDALRSGNISLSEAERLYNQAGQGADYQPPQVQYDPMQDYLAALYEQANQGFDTNAPLGVMMNQIASRNTARKLLPQFLGLAGKQMDNRNAAEQAQQNQQFQLDRDATQHDRTMDLEQFKAANRLDTFKTLKQYDDSGNVKGESLINMRTGETLNPFGSQQAVFSEEDIMKGLAAIDTNLLSDPDPKVLAHQRMAINSITPEEWQGALQELMQVSTPGTPKGSKEIDAIINRLSHEWKVDDRILRQKLYGG